MKAWVEAQSKDGRYANASDYVRDLIRRDQEYREAIAELQAAIDEGLSSGAAHEFSFDRVKARALAELREREIEVEP